MRLVWFSLLLVLGACDCGSDPAGPRSIRDCAGGERCADGPGEVGSDAGEPGGDLGPPDMGMNEPGGQGDVDGGTGECTTSDECTVGRCVAGGECIAGDGPCADDGDCGGDTYCCAEGCAADGEPFCVPYGSGPRAGISDTCTGNTPIGLFRPAVQCEWLAPPPGDAFPEHVQVLSTPLVANLGVGEEPEPVVAAPDAPPPPKVTTPGEIIINTYNFDDGLQQSSVGFDPNYFGVLRVLNGQDCTQLETISDPSHPLIGASAPAIGDLDGDGIPEIVALTANTGLIAFRYNEGTGAHETFWVASGSDIWGAERWDGPAIHDINDDGVPEVLSRMEVFDGLTGARINAGQRGLSGSEPSGSFPVVGDMDGDGRVELVGNDVFRWDNGMNLWVRAYDGASGSAQNHAIADFGTAGDPFDPTTLDGVAELVTSVAGILRIQTLDGTIVLEAASLFGNGPPTVGDLDNDGFPEVGTAGRERYAVVDFDCAAASSECEGGFIRWSAASQDASSARTGSSIFDFEGDGQAEVVYADECFTRIYDGLTGDVLYSAPRTSCTWYENAIVADPDRDENTEIIVGSNSNCGVSCPLIDPIHPGLRCEGPDDCASGMCEAGLCRCTADSGCDANTACAPSLEGGGNVCRGVHPVGEAQSGVRVLRDRLDRWVSSRAIWNQHTYSITNVNEDGTIPRTSEWVQNFPEPTMNNYRQNAQGERAQGLFPDITGRLDSDVCRQGDGEPTRLVSTVCNRGGRAVGAALPATFYSGPPEDGNILCTSYTEGAVPVGGCLEVSCVLNVTLEEAVVHVVVNDDGNGGATTTECIETNNTDQVAIEACAVLF